MDFKSLILTLDPVCVLDMLQKCGTSDAPFVTNFANLHVVHGLEMLVHLVFILKVLLALLASDVPMSLDIMLLHFLLRADLAVT